MTPPLAASRFAPRSAVVLRDSPMPSRPPSWVVVTCRASADVITPRRARRTIALPISILRRATGATPSGARVGGGAPSGDDGGSTGNDASAICPCATSVDTEPTGVAGEGAFL